jgi:hypothetical protein
MLVTPISFFGDKSFLARVMICNFNKWSIQNCKEQIWKICVFRMGAHLSNHVLHWGDILAQENIKK